MLQTDLYRKRLLVGFSFFSNIPYSEICKWANSGAVILILDLQFSGDLEKQANSQVWTPHLCTWSWLVTYYSEPMLCLCRANKTGKLYWHHYQLPALSPFCYPVTSFGHQQRSQEVQPCLSSELWSLPASMKLYRVPKWPICIMWEEEKWVTHSCSGALPALIGLNACLCLWN